MSLELILKLKTSKNIDFDLILSERDAVACAVLAWRFALNWAKCLAGDDFDVVAVVDDGVVMTEDKQG